MKYVRFEGRDGQPRYGRVEGEEILELSGSYFGPCKLVGRRMALNAARLLCPTVPSKVICLGLNYRDHAKEMKETLPEEPRLFLKPDTSVIGPGDAIRCPPMSKQVDYEAELGIIIGRTLRRVSPEEALAGVFGYTCLNDVTARDLQRKDGQWTRAKGFDTFCPIGPWITDEINPDDAEIELLLNGERKQHSNTSQFVFKTAQIISFISHVMTLKPGDAIGTGTPSGIGPMRPGDTVEVRIAGIGGLVNTVANE